MYGVKFNVTETDTESLHKFISVFERSVQGDRVLCTEANGELSVQVSCLRSHHRWTGAVGGARQRYKGC